MVKAGISGNRALNYILGTIGCWIIVFYYPFLKKRSKALMFHFLIVHLQQNHNH